MKISFALTGFALLLFFQVPANSAIISHSGTGDCNGSGAVGVELVASFVPCNDQTRATGHFFFSEITPYQISLEFDFPTGRENEWDSLVSNFTGEGWKQFDVRFFSNDPFSVEFKIDPTLFGQSASLGCGGGFSSFTVCDSASSPFATGLEFILFRAEFKTPFFGDSFFGLFADITPASDGPQSFSVVMTPRTSRIPEPYTIALVIMGLAGLSFFRRKVP